MSAHAGLLRGLALLVGVLTVGFVYEQRQAEDLDRATGAVVDVRRVGGTAFGGDDRRFTVRFTADGETHRFVTGRTLVGRFGRFAGLGVGGEVPVAFDPSDPGDAHVDTFSHTHDFTVTVAAFTTLYVLVVGGLVVAGRLR